jgi:hypothetical protein
MTNFAAFKNLFFGQPVPLRLVVSGAQPAIIEVVFAVTGKLNQSAHKNLLAVHFLRLKPRPLKKIIIIAGQNFRKLLP